MDIDDLEGLATECEDGEDDCDTGVESEIRQDPLRRSSGQQACDHARADDARDGEEGDDPAPRYGGHWSLFRDMRGSTACHDSPTSIRFTRRGFAPAALAQ